jgi:hypothetical protein
MENELLFIGMNLPEEIEKFLNEQESIITSGMTENEIRAYKLGIKNALLGLKSLVDSSDEHIVIHVNDEKYACELDIDNLKKMVDVE